MGRITDTAEMRSARVKKKWGKTARNTDGNTVLVKVYQNKILYAHNTLVKVQNKPEAYYWQFRCSLYGVRKSW